MTRGNRVCVCGGIVGFQMPMCACVYIFALCAGGADRRCSGVVPVELYSGEVRRDG